MIQEILKILMMRDSTLLLLRIILIQIELFITLNFILECFYSIVVSASTTVSTYTLTNITVATQTYTYTIMKNQKLIDEVLALDTKASVAERANATTVMGFMVATQITQVKTDMEAMDEPTLPDHLTNPNADIVPTDTVLAKIIGDDPKLPLTVVLKHLSSLKPSRDPAKAWRIATFEDRKLTPYSLAVNRSASDAVEFDEGKDAFVLKGDDEMSLEIDGTYNIQFYVCVANKTHVKNERTDEIIEHKTTHLRLKSALETYSTTFNKEYADAIAALNSTSDSIKAQAATAAASADADARLDIVDKIEQRMGDRVSNADSRAEILRYVTQTQT